jgi:hypothetical protein
MFAWLQKVVEVAKTAGAWAKTIPSEPNGNGSSSRIAFLLVTCTVCWLLYAYYCYRGALPDQYTLYGLASLVSAVAGAYGINKWMHKDDDPDGKGN